jgi:predicted ester cyclase
VDVRFTLRGTHGGELMGVPSTGKPISVGGIDINRIAGGKIAERWAVLDRMGLMQQLGVIPTPS